MAFSSSNKILGNAYKNGYAVGAFNFSTIEILNGIIDAASELNSPLILSTSENELKHLRPWNASALVKGYAEKLSIPVVLHLDHGKSFDMVKYAIDNGYTSVHIDASSLPKDENIELTRKVVDYAHKLGVWVEAEIGHVAGSSSIHNEEIINEANKNVFTDPDVAKEFVEKTNCNALAISIGNAHGLYKDAPNIRFNILEEIRKKVNIPLVLHGGSGIPEDQVKRAISLGIAKVNINTEMRIAFSNTIKEFLNQNHEDIVPYHILGKASDAVKEVVKQKIKMFGSEGKARM